MTTHKSWLHKIVLSGALICSTSMLSANTQAPALINTTIEQQAPALSEQEKWAYLISKLEVTQKDYTSLSNKIGTFVQNHALGLSIPTGLTAGTISGIIPYAIIMSTHDEDIRRYIPYELASPTMLRSTEIRLKLQITAIALAIGGMIITGTLAMIIAHWANKNIGQWLTGKPQKHQEKLASLFSQWEMHKPNMPTQMIPLLEKLYTDFDAQTNTFKTLTQKNTVKVIEAIIATSLIMDTQKAI